MSDRRHSLSKSGREGSKTVIIRIQEYIIVFVVVQKYISMYICTCFLFVCKSKIINAVILWERLGWKAVAGVPTAALLLGEKPP